MTTFLESGVVRAITLYVRLKFLVDSDIPDSSDVEVATYIRQLNQPVILCIQTYTLIHFR